MDRDEAIKLLKGGEEGIDEWNQRREALEGIPELNRADLSGALLSGALLSGADLRQANLRGANLNGADLSGANLNMANLYAANLSKTDLRGANLRLADLSGADLDGANLDGANLYGANLYAANLSETDLSGANFSGASLSGANFKEAYCYSTLFADVDLSVATGLDSVKHGRPSAIAIDTLIRSKGNIPEVFLRGCGVPEYVIVNRFEILGELQPIQFYSCFISYSHKDEEFAELLHNGLQDKGVRCWHAPHDLPIGAKIRPAIDSSIRVYDKFLLVLSEHSVNSQWVEQEVETALRREREQNAAVLFPVRLDDAVFSVNGGWPALVTNTRNIGDFRKWKEHDMFQETLARLLRDLKSVASTGVHPPISPETPR
jgi:TIR domain/Pentapeptide repeats (8 copies)